jgi:hypothetical protein
LVHFALSFILIFVFDIFIASLYGKPGRKPGMMPPRDDVKGAFATN